MPRIAKPTSDESRLTFLKTALSTGQTDVKSGNGYLNSETMNVCTQTAAKFEVKLNELSGFLASRSKEVREKNEAKARLELFIRDLWEVTKRRVFRNSEPAEVLTYYCLPLDGMVPPIITEKEIFVLAGQIIKGDEKAVSAGYPAAANPSAKELSVEMAKAQKEFNDVSPADRQFNQAQETLAPLRAKADEVIGDIIDDLEYNLRKKEASICRRIMRTYGVTFAYAIGEPVDEETTVTATAAK